MVSVSRETPAETDARLSRVVAQSRLKIYPGTYAFREFPLSDFPAAAHPEALALVRDDQVWSQLVPCVEQGEELFSLFRFHFPAGCDNSGFVGWLATRLKQRFGTGVFVTCGQNREDGGIFDYWGVPAALAEEVLQEVRRMAAAA